MLLFKLMRVPDRFRPQADTAPMLEIMLTVRAWLWGGEGGPPVLKSTHCDSWHITCLFHSVPIHLKQRSHHKPESG